MRKITYVAIFAMVCFALSGCAILPGRQVETKGRSFITDYPLNIAAVERAIKENRLIHGMNMNEVIESWGKPDIEDVISIRSRSYDVWAFRKNFNTRVLYFHDNVLVDIQ